VFPTYPNAAVNCPRGPVSCTLPAQWQQYATSEISAFAPDFKTPRVQQASLSLERELPGGLTGTLSYLLVHGVDMIRARDVNLPAPAYYSYPILNSTGNIVPNQFYNVESFATLQTSYSIGCPYPPCINPLDRPISQLGAIDQFESAASSVYNGMTVALHKRMSGGGRISDWHIRGRTPSTTGRTRWWRERRQRCRIRTRRRVSGHRV